MSVYADASADIDRAAIRYFDVGVSVDDVSGVNTPHLSALRQLARARTNGCAQNVMAAAPDVSITTSDFAT